MAKRKVKEVRIRKSRFEGTLWGCGHYVLRGETIVSIKGGKWMCLPCRQIRRKA